MKVLQIYLPEMGDKETWKERVIKEKSANDCVNKDVIKTAGWII